MKTSNFKIIFPLLLIIFIDTLGVGIFFPILSPLFMSNTGMLPITAGLGIRVFYYGLILGLFSLFMFLSSPVLGDLSDQIGRKKVLLICLYGTAICGVICALGILYENIPLLIIGRMFGGMVAGCQAIASAVIMDVSPTEEKTVNLSYVSIASCIGFFVGPMLGGIFSDKALISWFNYSTPFIIDAILALINAVLLTVTFKETFSKAGAISMNLKRQIAVYTDAVKHPKIRQLSLTLGFYEIAWAVYFQFIPIFLVQYFNYSSRQIGYFMSFIGFILGFAFLVLLRVLLKFYSDKQVAQAGIFLSTIMLFVSLLFKSVLGLWLIAGMITIGIGLAWSPILSLFSKAVTEDQQGWAMGVAAGVSALGWVPGIILTAVLDYININLPFIIAAIAMLISFIVISRYKVNETISH